MSEDEKARALQELTKQAVLLNLHLSNIAQALSKMVPLLERIAAKPSH